MYTLDRDEQSRQQHTLLPNNEPYYKPNRTDRSKTCQHAVAKEVSPTLEKLKLRPSNCKPVTNFTLIIRRSKTTKLSCACVQACFQKQKEFTSL